MYKIISNKQTKIVIEKSKFLSYIYPCKSLQAQTEILKEIKKQHLSATHICFASIIYNNFQIIPSFSDDKEPAGTAGAQILQALKEQDLINTLCVVVRYFGGIKLGVAGLGRAYKESALSAIKDNKKLVTLKTKCKIICNFNTFNKIKSYLQQNNIELINPEYTNSVSFNCFLNEDEQKFIKTNVELELMKEQDFC